MKIASSIVTEKFMALSLFCNSGIYYNHNLVSFDDSALKWGKELFDHYKGIARPITRVDLNLFPDTRGSYETSTFTRNIFIIND